MGELLIYRMENVCEKSATYRYVGWTRGFRSSISQTAPPSKLYARVDSDIEFDANDITILIQYQI